MNDLKANLTILLVRELNGFARELDLFPDDDTAWRTTPGITNRSPFLNSLFDQGVLRYGVNFVSDRSAMQSGETGGYATITGAKLTVMQAPPLYHTTGEGLDVISTPGLERIARFFAYFVKEVDKASRAQINPDH